MLCCPEGLTLRPGLRTLAFVPAVTLSLIGAEAASPSLVPTIARLRALPPPGTPDAVAVAGHSLPGDGGSGTFRFDRLSRAIDNDGTIVAPAAGGPGRWLRVYGRDLSVKWFGARGDGRTFDTARIQSAVDAVRPGETLHFPAGVYRIETDRGVKLKNDVRLDLGTATLTGSNVAGARCRLLEIQGRRNVLISGGTLVGSRLGSPEWGVGIFASDAQNLFIEDVKLRNFYFDGILLTGNRGCQQVVIRGVLALDNRRSGLTVAAGSGITVTDSSVPGQQGAVARGRRQRGAGGGSGRPERALRRLLVHAERRQRPLHPQRHRRLGLRCHGRRQPGPGQRKRHRRGRHGPGDDRAQPGGGAQRPGPIRDRGGPRRSARHQRQRAPGQPSRHPHRRRERRSTSGTTRSSAPERTPRAARARVSTATASSAAGPGRPSPAPASWTATTCAPAPGRGS